MKIYRYQNETGFSLLEVMVALTIFAVGVLAAAKMQYQSVVYNADANKLAQATLLAQGKVEEFIALDFDATVLDDDEPDGAGGLGDQTVATADGWENPPDYFGLYTLFWNVDATVADRKDIRVIVTWVEKGANRRYVLNSTLVR